MLAIIEDIEPKAPAKRYECSETEKDRFYNVREIFGGLGEWGSIELAFALMGRYAEQFGKTGSA